MAQESLMPMSRGMCFESIGPSVVPLPGGGGNGPAAGLIENPGTLSGRMREEVIP